MSKLLLAWLAAETASLKCDEVAKLRSPGRSRFDLQRVNMLDFADEAELNNVIAQNAELSQKSKMFYEFKKCMKTQKEVAAWILLESLLLFNDDNQLAAKKMLEAIEQFLTVFTDYFIWPLDWETVMVNPLSGTVYFTGKNLTKDGDKCSCRFKDSTRELKGYSCLLADLVNAFPKVKQVAEPAAQRLRTAATDPTREQLLALLRQMKAGLKAELEPLFHERQGLKGAASSFKKGPGKTLVAELGISNGALLVNLKTAPARKITVSEEVLHISFPTFVCLDFAECVALGEIENPELKAPAVYLQVPPDKSYTATVKIQSRVSYAGLEQVTYVVFYQINASMAAKIGVEETFITFKKGAFGGFCFVDDKFAFVQSDGATQSQAPVDASINFRTTKISDLSFWNNVINGYFDPSNKNSCLQFNSDLRHLRDGEKGDKFYIVQDEGGDSYNIASSPFEWKVPPTLKIAKTELKPGLFPTDRANDVCKFSIRGIKNQEHDYASFKCSTIQLLSGKSEVPLSVYAKNRMDPSSATKFYFHFKDFAHPVVYFDDIQIPQEVKNPLELKLLDYPSFGLTLFMKSLVSSFGLLVRMESYVDKVSLLFCYTKNSAKICIKILEDYKIKTKMSSLSVKVDGIFGPVNFGLSQFSLIHFVSQSGGELVRGVNLDERIVSAERIEDCYEYGDSDQDILTLTFKTCPTLVSLNPFVKEVSKQTNLCEQTSAKDYLPWICKPTGSGLRNI